MPCSRSARLTWRSEIEARRHVEDRDAVVIPIGEHLARFDRPAPTLNHYDTLLEA